MLYFYKNFDPIFWVTADIFWLLIILDFKSKSWKIVLVILTVESIIYYGTMLKQYLNKKKG